MNEEENFAPISSAVSLEVDKFRKDCEGRYTFNSHWDNVMNILGLLLGVCIVGAGVTSHSKIAAILGAFVSAIVSAQRAFPFGSRAQFYRMLIGQTENLRTQIEQSLLPKEAAVAALNSLRLAYAQQFPQGVSFKSDAGAE
jgi:hypothetical protein